MNALLHLGALHTGGWLGNRLGLLYFSSKAFICISQIKKICCYQAQPSRNPRKSSQGRREFVTCWSMAGRRGTSSCAAVGTASKLPYPEAHLRDLWGSSIPQGTARAQDRTGSSTMPSSHPDTPGGASTTPLLPVHRALKFLLLSPQQPGAEPGSSQQRAAPAAGFVLIKVL